MQEIIEDNEVNNIDYMKDWKEVRLGDVINFNPTETLKKGTVAKKIAMEKLNTFSRDISGFEMAEYSGGTKFRNGDTLLARITPCLENGKTAQVRVLEKDEIGFGSTEYIVMREIPDITDRDFIYYLAISEQFRSIAIKSMTGTTGRQRAQIDLITNTMYSLPPLLTQQKIAQILSSLDDKIELNNAINKNLEEIAQTLFKQWFVDFEFPNENGEPYKSSGGEMVESELGMIPKGWRVGTLGEIVKLRGDRIKKENIKQGTPYVPIDVIPRKKMVLTEFKSNEEANSSLVSFYENDILFGAMRSYFHKVVIAPFEGITRNTCFVLVSLIQEDLSFSFLRIFQEDTINYSERTSKGSTMPYAVWEGTMENMSIILPPKVMRAEFNKTIYPILDMMKKSIFETQTLTKLRDELLPKLMSGEIQV